MAKEKPGFLRNTATKDSGFTLIELLIVIAIIAILAAAVIIAVNPGEQLSKARDATRERHVQALESALYVYQYDNGIFPAGITSTLTEICNTNIEEVVCGDLTDLSGIEIGSIPVNPLGGIDDNGTGYLVAVLDDKLLLDAPKAETRLVDININGLVGWWKMDEDPAVHGTIVADSSGYGNHGTLSTNDGSTNKSVEGKMDKATEFDGTDDYVDCGNDESLNPSDAVTMSAWFYSENFSQVAVPFVKKLQYRFHFHTNGSFYTDYHDGEGNRHYSSDSYTSLGLVENSRWYYITIVYTGYKKQIYIDGEKKVDRNKGAGGIQINQGYNFNIGSEAGTYTFNGLIDDVRIYNRALSESEIQSLYNQGL